MVSRLFKNVGKSYFLQGTVCNIHLIPSSMFVCVKLHNEELNDLYFSPNIVWVIKSRRMRWVGHVACVGKGRGVYGVWRGNLRERDHWGDPGVGGRIILRWIFRKWDVGLWTGSSWLRIETGGKRMQ
jgi:hypothetical protein